MIAYYVDKRRGVFADCPIKGCAKAIGMVALGKHIYDDHGRSKIQCVSPICASVYMDSRDYAYHLSQAHFEIKCDLCKRLLKVPELRDHLTSDVCYENVNDDP